jgi:hypothetical protein
MNDQLQDFARKTLKEGLAKLPTKSHEMFKLMYARNGGKRSVEDSLRMDIDSVVAEIPADKLDWAMQQVQRSLDKQESKP